MGELHETVDRLLHDAEHKESAAHFAETLMREPQKAVEFRVERDALVAEANRLDPSHAAPAWAETDLPHVR